MSRIPRVNQIDGVKDLQRFSSDVIRAIEELSKVFLDNGDVKFPKDMYVEDLILSDNSIYFGGNKNGIKFGAPTKDDDGKVLEFKKVDKTFTYSLPSALSAPPGHGSSHVVGGSDAVFSAQAHIIDADGTLADLTTKFNTLLSQLETLGLLASS